MAAAIYLSMSLISLDFHLFTALPCDMGATRDRSALPRCKNGALPEITARDGVSIDDADFGWPFRYVALGCHSAREVQALYTRPRLIDGPSVRAN